MTSTQPYSGTDFYCDVALPDPDSLDVVHEDERVLVYHHTRPFWAVHLVAVPKRHIPSLTDTCGATDEDLCARSEERRVGKARRRRRWSRRRAGAQHVGDADGG